MNLKYPHLFTPIKLGSVTFKNRIFSSPISLQELSPECFLTQENIAFFELRAKGGAANVTIGCAIVSEDGRGHTKEIRLNDPLSLPSLTHVARSIKRHNCVPSIELHHAGKFAGIPNLENPKPKYKPYGPMREEYPDGTIVEEMSEEKILSIVEDYATGAKRVMEAGFEMVMVHGAHGWLLSQFMSPENKRTDKYGGSLENRMRFPVMILKAVREAVGPGVPIEFRLNGKELYDEGHGLDEAIEMAKIVQDYVDLIQVTGGNQHVQETFVGTHPSMFLPHGVFLDLATEIKKNVNIPVAVVAAITDPDLAEDFIASGKVDVIEMARGLMADPFLPKKAKEGRDEDIVKCMRCHVCMSTIIGTRDTACALNPVIGEEELYFSPPAPPRELKKVLIAGGGPGGMRAAITAAERGHNVILCEASEKLGGQILCERHVDFKKNFYAYVGWLKNQLKKLDNVEIRLNTKVTKDLAETINPDVLICAIGASPTVPNIPGIDDERIVFCNELAKEAPNIGQKVVIIGAGLVGSETAVHFRREGKEVTLLEMRNDFAIDANMFQKMALNIELRDNIDLHLNTTVKAITKEGVVAVDADGKETTYPADTIFCAVGMKSHTDEVEALRDVAMEFIPVGDCVCPGKVQTAIHHGYYAALDI